MPVRTAWAAMVLSLLFHYAGQNARAGERYEAVLLDCKANFYVSHIVWVIGKSHTWTSQNRVPHSDEPRCGQKQAARTEREYPRPYSDPPFVRRFLEAFPFIPASLGFFVLAWFRFSRGREVAGWAFIVSGCLAFCAGTAIIMLTLNPETWEWWV